MDILSEYSVIEYFISLSTNNYQSSNYSKFTKLIQDNFKAIRTISIISTKRNMIFEFYLNGTPYILKHFSQKRVNLTQEKDTSLQTPSNYFNSEKEVLEIEIKLDFLPKLYFADNQSNTIVMERLLNYEDFYSYYGENLLGDDTLREDYLKKLAEILTSFPKKDNVKNLFQNNKRNILMIGELKNHEELFGYYQKYCCDWNEDSPIHGDLFSRNILVNAKTKNIKIIDWEMATVGDIYFDISTIISILFDCWIGITFPDVLYTISNNSSFFYEKLKKDIDFFLNAYEQASNDKIIREKLKTFLIINTQHRSTNIDNLIKNIEIIFL